MAVSAAGRTLFIYRSITLRREPNDVYLSMNPEAKKALEISLKKT